MHFCNYKKTYKTSNNAHEKRYLLLENISNKSSNSTTLLYQSIYLSKATNAFFCIKFLYL